MRTAGCSCYSAVRRGGWFDRLSGVISVGAIAIPSFVVALYSLLLFAVALRWLPAIGAGEAGDPGDQLLHLILPAFAIGLGCELRHASRLVYSAGLDLDAVDEAVPIGPGCKTCERAGCAQRAFPQIGRALAISEHRSTFSPYPVE